MEDVIFAGTSSRPPLGRAQVSLTIDNSDHTLDIDYTEVTISRTIFRNGGSEYAINGSQCRLLDIQELLSDTGLGQQMHVIVGQGTIGCDSEGRPVRPPCVHRRGRRHPEAPQAQGTRVAQAGQYRNEPEPTRRFAGEIHRQLGPSDARHASPGAPTRFRYPYATPKPACTPKTLNAR